MIGCNVSMCRTRESCFYLKEVENNGTANQDKDTVELVLDYYNLLNTGEQSNAKLYSLKRAIYNNVRTHVQNYADDKFNGVMPVGTRNLGEDTHELLLRFVSEIAETKFIRGGTIDLFNAVVDQVLSEVKEEYIQHAATTWDAAINNRCINAQHVIDTIWETPLGDESANQVLVLRKDTRPLQNPPPLEGYEDPWNEFVQSANDNTDFLEL